MSQPRRLGIIGVGLIGGSIGLRARALGRHVLGADDDADALREAERSGAIDEIADRDRLYDDCEVVVLAAHLRGIVAELERLDRARAARVGLILDVGSVKVPVVHAASGLRNFVGTHPMAGSQRSGASAADARLFEGCAWAYVPSGNSALDRRASACIAEFGGEPLPVDAVQHDAIAALTSHMPQVFAEVFARRFNAQNNTPAAPLCGPVAHELLRIGREAAPMWDDVFQMNARNIALELHAMARELEAQAERYIRKTP